MADKKYYLIKQWSKARGETSDNPSCYFCGGHVYPHPLSDVKRELCYTSEKRAQRYVDKCREQSLRSQYEVIEVPSYLLMEG